jgi:hypothetical protein
MRSGITWSISPLAGYGSLCSWNWIGAATQSGGVWTPNEAPQPGINTTASSLTTAFPTWTGYSAQYNYH